MSHRDILNPKPGYDPEIGDSMNPSYNFSIERPDTRVVTKPVGGGPQSREVSNTGHQLVLGWIGRTRVCYRRLKRFQEQYENSYFTFIDHEGGGRHYVGRFTTPVKGSPTANNKWDMQNVTFEEVPGAPMIKYPSNWEEDAVKFGPVDDAGDQLLATSGAWTMNTRLAESDTDPAQITMDNPGNAGEWACFEYRGYGFKLYMLKGPDFGKVQVYVDGQLLQTVDLYSAQYLASTSVVEREALPLDFHRVKVVCTGDKNAASSSAAVAWQVLEVMR